LRNIIETLELYFAKVADTKNNIEALKFLISNLYDILIFHIKVTKIYGLKILKSKS